MGAVNPISHVIPNNIKTLKPNARPKPSRLANGCCDDSRSLEIKEIKMILSIPKTISRKVKVSNDSNPSGLMRTSMVHATVRLV